MVGQACNERSNGVSHIEDDEDLIETKVQYTKTLLRHLLEWGEVDMEPDVTAEYMKVVHNVSMCPLGVYLPLIGLVTREKLLTYVKLLTAICPVVTTMSLTFAAAMEKDGAIQRPP